MASALQASCFKVAVPRTLDKSKGLICPAVQVPAFCTLDQKRGSRSFSLLKSQSKGFRKLAFQTLCKECRLSRRQSARVHASKQEQEDAQKSTEDRKTPSFLEVWREKLQEILPQKQAVAAFLVALVG